MHGYSPLGGEGGLLGYPLLGERVGCKVTSRWRSWFYGCFPLGKLVSGLLPLGERVGCMITPRWGRGWVAWLLPPVEVNNDNNVLGNCPSVGTRSMGI